MGRRYAGVLGPLAFAIVVLRGLLHASSVESTLLCASISLMGFAAVGFITGQTAEWIIQDGVRSQFAARVAAQQATANDGARLQ